MKSILKPNLDWSFLFKLINNTVMANFVHLYLIGKSWLLRENVYVFLGESRACATPIRTRLRLISPRSSPPHCGNWKFTSIPSLKTRNAVANPTPPARRPLPAMPPLPRPNPTTTRTHPRLLPLHRPRKSPRNPPRRQLKMRKKARKQWPERIVEDWVAVVRSRSRDRPRRRAPPRPVRRRRANNHSWSLFW